MTSYSERKVYEDDELLVFYEEKSPDVAVVTFNEMGFSSKTRSWGGGTVAAAGFSYFGFVSKRPNWFPMDSILNAVEGIRQHLTQYKSIVTYGHSQGGYAAIKYSGILNANTVLSFCPQYSISPHEMDGEDQRFSKYFTDDNRHEPIGSSDIGEATNIFVFYDPLHGLDKKNFNYIKRSVPCVNGVKVIGVGHNAVRPFAGTQALKSIVAAALVNDLQLIWKLSRDLKRRWTGRRVYLAREISKRNSSIAISLLDEDVSRLNGEVAHELFSNLYSSGEYDYISERSDIFMSLTPVTGWLLVIASLRAVGRDYEALKLIAAKHFVEKGHLLDINSHFYSTDTVNNFVKRSAVSYGDGWHNDEGWGRWSGAKWSRIYIDLTEIPGGIARIPVSLFEPIKQNLKAYLISMEGRQLLDLGNGSVSLKKEMGRVVLDFHVDQLLSPMMLKINRDKRPLGIRFPNYDKWVFDN